MVIAYFLWYNISHAKHNLKVNERENKLTQTIPRQSECGQSGDTGNIQIETGTPDDVKIDSEDLSKRRSILRHHERKTNEFGNEFENRPSSDPNAESPNFVDSTESVPH